ncbi:MAG: hypothetical protein CMO81_07070 [Waddliaceae bacterium]|nr:hypothetical protein [Waddliaceae bacterium]
MKIYDLNANFQLFLNDEISKPLPLEQEEKVEAIWQAALSRSDGHLFNAPCLIYKEWNGTSLIGSWLDYKYYFSSQIDKSLAKDLNLQAISVSGITVNDGKYLIGKRSKSVTQHPGAWEFVPSGGIDASASKETTIDYQGQIIKELYEETGINSTFIEKIEPVFLQHVEEDAIWEICVLIHLCEEVVIKSCEHEDLKWCSEKEVKKSFGSGAYWVNGGKETFFRMLSRFTQHSK